MLGPSQNRLEMEFPDPMRPVICSLQIMGDQRQLFRQGNTVAG